MQSTLRSNVFCFIFSSLFMCFIALWIYLWNAPSILKYPPKLSTIFLKIFPQVFTRFFSNSGVLTLQNFPLSFQKNKFPPRLVRGLPSSACRLVHFACTQLSTAYSCFILRSAGQFLIFLVISRKPKEFRPLLSQSLLIIFSGHHL